MHSCRRAQERKENDNQEKSVINDKNEIEKMIKVIHKKKKGGGTKTPDLTFLMHSCTKEKTRITIRDNNEVQRELIEVKSSMRTKSKEQENLT